MTPEFIPWLSSFLYTPSLGDLMQSAGSKCYLKWLTNGYLQNTSLLSSTHQSNCILDPSAWLSNRYLRLTALNSHMFLNPLLMFSSLAPQLLSPPLNYGSSISAVAQARILGVLLVFSPQLIPNAVLLAFPLQIYHKSYHFLPTLLLSPRLEPPSFLARIRATVS